MGEREREGPGMTKQPVTMEGAVCPVPIDHREVVVIGHRERRPDDPGAHQPHLLSGLREPPLLRGDDSAVVEPRIRASRRHDRLPHRLAALLSGGDIGRLAVCGTVNDLAMVGARPQWLTAGFILEEGLSLETLQRARQIDEGGCGGSRRLHHRRRHQGRRTRESRWSVHQHQRRRDHPEAGGKSEGHAPNRGTCVLVSGTLGDHGIAVLAARGQLQFEADVISDVAPLNGLVEAMFEACPGLGVLGIPRGGLATALNEIARQSEVGIHLDEPAIPIGQAVTAACELLGLDPLYVANEGKLVAIVPPEQAGAVLEAMRAHPLGRQACRIGEVIAEPAGRVLMRTSIGGTRIVDMLAGEMLPPNLLILLFKLPVPISPPRP